MPLPPAPPLPLRPGDREKLEAMVRKQTLAQREVERARLNPVRHGVCMANLDSTGR